MKRKKRAWESDDDDPTTGLVNLFDVWMVFTVALLLAMTGLAVQSAGSPADSSDPLAALEALSKAGKKVEKVRISKEQLSGEGERLGTAYRLKSGEIVYIPEDRKP